LNKSWPEFIYLFFFKKNYHCYLIIETTLIVKMIPETVEILLYKRRDFVKHVDSDGNSALHYAVQKDNAKIVEMLILKDTSLAYCNNLRGQTPLHLAVQYGSELAIEAILKHCPDAAEQVICFNLLI
jgi:ankyrin repeat protein